ncbi:MAG: AbrB/MazE/SpoVT family DNA-binding domain-containing protein [Candidatus Woesearchaeota archaeon]|jgi:antitoxin component of MazEF toxin-antitoxin module
MRRKLIKQGGYGLTVYIPKKWIDAHHLKEGDELEFTSVEEGMLITAQTRSKEKKTISFPINKGRESTVRTLLVNAYRAGFDRIDITYEGNEQDLQDIVDKFMLGFALFKKDNGYFLENITEPSAETFENIFQKQFYLIEQILQDISSPLLIGYVHIVQKHDNFLKRCLSKDLFHHPATFFLWQFLSYLTQIARLCYHLHRKSKGNIGKDNAALLVQLQKMFSLLSTAYLKKDFTILSRLHEVDETMQNILFKSKDTLSLHYLLMINRNIYLANSPLTGYLQLKSHI